ASLAGLGRHTRRGGRVAVRSIVRTRTRSAAVVMALAAINAGAVAMATAFASRTDQVVRGAPEMPNNALIVIQREGFFDTPPPTTKFRPIPASVERAMHSILPDATVSSRRAALGASVGNGSVPGANTGGGQGFAPKAMIVGPLATQDTLVVADPS